MLASRGCAGGGSVLDRPAAQRGAGSCVSRDTCNGAGAMKLLQTPAQACPDCFALVAPKIGRTNTPSSNLLHLHLFVSLIVHFFQPYHISTASLHLTICHLTLQQFQASPVSCWCHYASVPFSFLQIQPVSQSS